MPRPKILMFVPKYPFPVEGGLERQSHELSKKLKQLGINTQVLSAKFDSRQARHEEVEGVPVTRVYWSDHVAFRFLLLPFLLIFEIWRKRDDFDVLHLHQHSWASLFLLLVAKLMRKSVLTKLSNVGSYGVPGMQEKVFGKARIAILRRSDAIIAMSQQSVDELLGIGHSRHRILTVPNGIEINSSKLITRKNSKSCRVVYVGRLSDEKQIHVLLQAWVAVVAKFGNTASLELWGVGPLEAELQQYCDELCISETVKFVGHVPDVRKQLLDMDIFTLPSLFEGNSNSVLEAMSAGLPIVATAVGGTSMQVGPEGADLLFAAGDVNSLSQKLIMLIQDSSSRRAYGKAMSTRVEKYFDLNKVAKTYLHSYELLIGQDDPDLTNSGFLPNSSDSCAV